jgi:hypothetical protein
MSLEHPVTTTTEPLAKNDLNYTSYGELIEHRDLLSGAQRDLLSHLSRRHLKGHLTDEFNFTASIFTLLDHPEAYNHVHCGEARKGGRVTCRDPFFCQNCANIPANQFLEKTVTRFEPSHWFFVTLSFEPLVPFGSLNMDYAERYWRVTRDTLHAADSLWDGCVYREEVALSGFLPLMIRPHAHLLVYVEDSHLDVVAIRQAFEDAARPVSALSFDWRPVVDLDDYLRTVRYIFKPVDVSTPYRKAWAMLGEDFSGPELISKRRQVNSELTDFVYGVQLLRPEVPAGDFNDVGFWRAGDEGQRRTVFRGVLDAKSKKSLCLSKPQIAVARPRIDRILRQGASGAKRRRRVNRGSSENA